MTASPPVSFGFNFGSRGARRARTLRVARATLLAAAALAAAAPAQRIPWQVVPTATEGELAELRAGRDHAAAGRIAEARAAFVDGLVARPQDPSILRELLSLAGDDGDARALWSDAWRAAAADGDGKTSPDPATAKPLSDERAGSAAAVARAAAARELARFAKASKDAAAKAMRSGLVARRTALLLWDLLADAPALVPLFGKEADETLAAFVPDPKPVLAALEGIVAAGANTDKPDLALRAALAMVALARQAAFNDVRGPKPPDLKASLESGRRAVDAIRAAKAKTAKAWTVEELRALGPEERAAFTKNHASWINPGVAVSPKALYRVETTCGFETLLGTAETVDLHHERLATWFGVDPFVARQGIVRVVPEPSGLEAEGTPYWWAGGFQSGDVTSVVFSVGDIESLGHLLTHELTHRFDGAVHPFLPAWASEGRGVWTAAAYASTLDARFEERHASFGTIEDAFIKGYGSLENFTHLVAGTLKEYRHNYPAGYALWMYLSTWEEGGRRLFAPKVEGYLKGMLKGRQRPVDWFAACFCDGRDGRPKTFEAFVPGFGEFLKGFYWQSRAPWTSRYVHRAGKSKRSPWVYDGPTWHAGRSRAEPWFGQDEARIAGDVLWDAGRRKEALLAYAWALEVDEPTVEILERCAILADEQGLKDLAWAARAEAARLFPEVVAAPGPAPFLGALPKTQAYLKARRDHVADLEKQGRVVAAAAFAADHDRMAATCGLPPLSRTAPADKIAATGAPFDPPARPLARFGFEEDLLTDFEERRVPDLWFATPEGDLHVGRTRPRDGTGELDRALLQRDAFARTKEWVPAGRYVVEGRIHFTTSFCSGAVIVGYRRGDRAVRLNFTGGDYLYSAGVNQAAAKLDSVGWGLSGRRTRDGGLPGATPGGTFAFGGERSSFRFALLVDGPEVHAFLDDKWVGSYADADGRPVEGHVGFATGNGAVRVARPVIRRLDRGRASGLRALREDGLDLAVDGTLDGDGLRNRRIRGIPAGRTGTLLVWIAPPPKPFDTPEEEVFDFDGVLEVARKLPELRANVAASATWVVAFPESYGPEKAAQFRAVLKERGGDGVVVATHRRRASLLSYGGEGRPPAPVPTFVFADPLGFYRAHADWSPAVDALPEPLGHLVRAFAGR